MLGTDTFSVFTEPYIFSASFKLEFSVFSTFYLDISVNTEFCNFSANVDFSVFLSFCPFHSPKFDICQHLVDLLLSFCYLARSMQLFEHHNFQDSTLVCSEKFGSEPKDRREIATFFLPFLVLSSIIFTLEETSSVSSRDKQHRKNVGEISCVKSDTFEACC